MKKSGIYQILNTVNNKFYIGSAVYFYDRWNTHKYCLRQDKHKNKYLQSAWNKYGEDAFEFRVLEYCDKNDLLKKEQGWLDWTKCYERDIGYNLFKTAGSALGTKWTEERKVIHSNFMKGFRHTEEAKEKMRGRIKSKEEVEKTRLSKLGKPRSEETKPSVVALPCIQEANGQLKPALIGGLETQRVYQGNFLEMAKQLPDQSVDIIIADPPYNASKGNALSLEYGMLAGTGGSWQKIGQVWDDMSLEDYLAFTMNWLTEARRILKQSGSMWVHGTYHSAGVTNVAMQFLDIEIINEIVWYKRNSFPNLAGRRLTASHETILWAHRGGKRAYRFNYEHSKNGDFSDDDLKSPGKQMRTVWDLPNNKPRHEQAHGKHPAQKPVRLGRRFIQLSAGPGDLCVVPFAGSGTECVAAQEEGLHYIGFETDQAYVDIARARLNGGVEK